MSSYGGLDMRGGFFLRVLGPLEITSSGSRCVPPAGRQRVLLASLVLAVNRAVPVDALIEQMWAERPPNGTRAALHTAVLRLRRALGSDLIMTVPDGYQLTTAEDSIDLYRFRRLVASAETMSDAEAELTLLREACGLWRGRPFAGTSSLWIDRDVVPGLTEEWFVATERRIDLEMSSGRHSELVPELRELTGTYPTREGLWHRLMTALHRSGRRAESLDAYQRARRIMHEELGLDPSAELQRLQRTILLGSVEVVSHRDVGGSAGDCRAGGGHQLPNDVADFAGRVEELDALDSLLRTGAADSRATLIVIDGAAAVGKTALAVRWAYQVRNRYPDGQFYLDLGGWGTGRPVPAATAMSILIEALGGAGVPAGGDLEAQAALLRAALGGRRSLILLDNVASAGQVRPFIPGPENLVVVTSRSQLRGLAVREGAHRVTVPHLSRADAITFLRAAIDVSADVLGELADRCDRLPLALAIIAERLRRTGNVAEVMSVLDDERTRLDALHTGDKDPHTAMRTVLSWSYRGLRPTAASMFRLLGRYPAADFAVSDAASLAGVPVRAAAAAIDQLVDVHLVRADCGLYRMSGLVRLFAAERAAVHDRRTTGVGSHRPIARPSAWHG